MDTGVIALLGVATTLIGTLIAILTFSSTLRKSAAAEGENRGRMAQRMDEAERDINRAHEKIGTNRDTIIQVDKSLAELSSGQKHMIQSLDELKTDVKAHIKEG